MPSLCHNSKTTSSRKLSFGTVMEVMHISNRPVPNRNLGTTLRWFTKGKERVLLEEQWSQLVKPVEFCRSISEKLHGLFKSAEIKTTMADGVDSVFCLQLVLQSHSWWSCVETWSSQSAVCRLQQETKATRGACFGTTWPYTNYQSLQAQPQLPFQPIQPMVKMLKWIPRGFRKYAAEKLTSILSGVVSNNDHDSWLRLLQFSGRCLQVPMRQKGGRQSSLTSLVNKQLMEEVDLPVYSRKPAKSGGKKCSVDPLEYLAKRVSAKLEEGDFKGAVRLACSRSTIADRSDATFEALVKKHPPAHHDTSIPPLGEEPSTTAVSEEEIINAIRSFPNGFAGGPDGLRPQHLKDMIRPTTDDGGAALVSALAQFVTLVLAGKTPLSICPFFFGASLTALTKKEGGIRPIAVGCTLRRLAAKVACFRVREEMADLLAPKQLGYGVSGGAEAAVHAARLFVHNLEEQCVLKLDFKNAFNSLRRDKMLQAIKGFAPSLFPLVHAAYSAPSTLFWGDKTIQSAEGVQQGDPLGPLLFFLTIHPLVSKLKSEFCVWYLDDGTVGGEAEVVKEDLEAVRQEGLELGLELNEGKSEVICADPVVRDSVLEVFQGANVIDPTCASLLGSPIGDEASVSDAISEKTGLLQLMGERLQHVSAQDALLLLRNSFAIPKMLYLLRTSPSFLSGKLPDYDKELRSIVCAITNSNLDDSAWLQASLPIKHGGFGIRSAVSSLSSALASSDLVHLILPPRFGSTQMLHVDAGITTWSLELDHPPPQGPASNSQKVWDAYRVRSAVDSLLAEAKDVQSKARLMASRVKESGAWLSAVPISSVGLRMDDSTVRIAVGLRLGTTLCHPHSCHHCGAEVNSLGTHGLSCKRSEGRHYRHSALNDIVHRALTTAHDWSPPE